MGACRTKCFGMCADFRHARNVRKIQCFIVLTIISYVMNADSNVLCLQFFITFLDHPIIIIIIRLLRSWLDFANDCFEPSLRSHVKDVDTVVHANRRESIPLLENTRRWRRNPFIVLLRPSAEMNSDFEWVIPNRYDFGVQPFVYCVTAINVFSDLE